jgi:hypothetical protein
MDNKYIVPSITNKPTENIIHVPYTTKDCRTCGNLFQRRFDLQPTCDEYFRCANCRGVKSIDIKSLCSIQ